MKRLTQLTLCALLMVLCLFFSAYSSGRAQPLPAQHLSGDAARQLLAGEGILPQIPLAGPDELVVEPAPGRSFLEPQPAHASDAAPGDNFGASVALAGDTLVAGAPSTTVGPNDFQGAAYVFDRADDGSWTQGQKLVAGDGAAHDHFGVSVALDGQTIIVGADGSDVDARPDQGAVFVFALDGATWSERQKLTAGDGAANDHFGVSVALDGDTVAVGADSADIGSHANQGAAYTFARGVATWVEQQKVTAGDGAALDYFGGSIALDGDALVIGSALADIGPSADQGAVYAFAFDGATWNQQQKLTAGDGAESDGFGGSVALDAGVAVAGACGVDLPLYNNHGAAYVFTRRGGSWNEQQRLLLNFPEVGGCLGAAVALEGDTIVAGARGVIIGVNDDQGAAYVFTRNDSVWSEQQKLLARDGGAGDSFGRAVALDGSAVVVGAPEADAGANEGAGRIYIAERGPIPWPARGLVAADDGGAGDNLGYSAALSGDTAIVGAYGADVGAHAGQGAAYIFTREGAGWVERQKLTAGDGAAGDSFGISVALHGNAAIIGAYLADIGAHGDQGAAYVFSLEGSNWNEQQKLTALDGAAGDNFGVSVALDGDTAAVGAYAADVGADNDQGAAYLFTRGGTSWSQGQKLVAADGAARDFFGVSAALSGGTAAVGANWADVGANGNQGAVYLFTREGGVWSDGEKLVAGDGAAADYLGYALDLDGGTLVAGAFGADIDGKTVQGAAYVFALEGGSWSEAQKLTAGDGAAGDYFGLSVALSGQTIIVGAHLADIGVSGDQGAAYVYRRAANGAPWRWEQKLLAGNGAWGVGISSEQVGRAVAVDGDAALAGAPSYASARGRVHFFERLVLIYDVFLPGVLNK